MNLLNKKQAEEQFGAMSLWDRSNILGGIVGYLTGVPVFDELKLLRSDKEGATLNIEVRPKGVVLSTLKGLTFHFVGFPVDKIQYVVIEPQQQIIEKKDKSIVGRALIGGLLLGPVGAIVGGMTGVGEKNVVVSKNIPDNLMTFAFLNEDNSQGQVLISVKDKHLKTVQHYFEKYLPGLLKFPDEIVEPTVVIPSMSVADEILKLKGLLDMGALTQSEFEEAKKKLLA